MSIDPLDRPHDQQPVPGQDQNPSQSPRPGFVTDNPDIPPAADGGTQHREPPGQAPADESDPGPGNPLP